LKGVTHADTAWIQVRPTPSPLATFSIQPAPGDSAKVAYDYDFGVNKTVTVFATDITGNVLRDESTNDLLVNFVSKDKSIAEIDHLTGNVKLTNNIGHVVFYASTYAYGVVASDSLLFTIGYPLRRVYNLILTCWKKTPGGVLSVDHFSPDSITIGVGGTVRILSGCSRDLDDVLTPDTLDLVFDDQTVVPDGMFLITKDFPLVTFKINQEGVFHYHSNKYGGNGTIVASSGP